MSQVIERVKLYYRQGRSDKVYEIELIAEENGLFHVIGYNGRRGAQLVAQPKTSRAVPLATARRIFNQLEQAKLCHRKTPYNIAGRETFTNTNNKTSEQPITAPEQHLEQTIDIYQATNLDAIEL